jgi:N-acetylneuraminate synthase
MVPRREARRSIVLTRDLKAGDVIGERDVTTKRPGTGISPTALEMVIGRKILQDCPEDTILTWEMV